jgi:hypothetical protein
LGLRIPQRLDPWRLIFSLSVWATAGLPADWKVRSSRIRKNSECLPKLRHSATMQRDMKSALRSVVAIALFVLSGSDLATAADFNFFGRSGDAIEINLGSIPGIAAGSSFSSLNTTGFANHTVLTSDTITAQPFASSGRLWVFANPASDTAAQGDTNTAARGFQGTLSGSVLVNGVTKTFSVTVAPGYTGSGAGAVQYNYEQYGGSTNKPLFVAQQQQRLRYLGFIPEGGDDLVVDGLFGSHTDTAFRTFQGVYIGGYSTNQSDADGIVGPNATAWLNSANAPMWGELVDPDPQTPGTWSTSRMIGDFDILPGVDSNGERTGYTRNQERFGSSWAMDLIRVGSPRAKSYTGRTQRINAISRYDGFSSTCCHASSHLVGMDIDLGTDSDTWNWGDGIISYEEAKVAQHVYGFFTADAAEGRVIRVISSNHDIEDAIHNLDSSINVFHDSTGGHQNHIHLDVGAPARDAGLANLPGDFNLDDVVDTKDYILWRANLNKTLTQSDFNLWRANFAKKITNRPIAAGVDFEFVGGGLGITSVPEPSAGFLVLTSCIIAGWWRRRGPAHSV